MQFSENWLRTMADPKLTSDELSHLLTMAGLEVEETEAVAPPFSNVVVAKVLEVAPHPNADRLRVCQVDVGAGAVLNIVCGAPNVRAGMKAVCAKAGAVLPPGDDGKPFEIKVGKLRGIESQGMMCSARELKLSEEHSGLMELPEDAPVGQNIRDYLELNDLKFTIKLTPNKADCLSVLGVAREVAALTGCELKTPEIHPVAVTLDEKLAVKVSAPDLCGRFAGRIIRGLNVKAQTPDWIKQRLERSGQRPVSPLVDISNYVMFELGRPSHVFDLAKIEGGLEVRWGRKGEQLKLLNGNTIELDEWVGVIADAKQVESLAGIMGGDYTAVSDDTTDIYLEAAFWWPQAVQGRSRKFNFSTDAGHRFERGVDFENLVEHIERITALIVEVCGTPDTRVGPVDDTIVNLPQRKPVKMRTARAAKIIGIPFTDAQVADIFSRLKLPFTLENGVFEVTPPSFRFDLEIEEDLIEEVARIYGFDNIPALPPLARSEMRAEPESRRGVFALRERMADQGYQEVVNYSFVDDKDEANLAGNQAPIRLLNPIASQMNVMRSNLFSGLVGNLCYNLNRKQRRVRVFELGAVFLRDDSVQDGPLTIKGFAQPKRLAALAYGPAFDEQWGMATRNVDYFDLKADLEAMLAPAQAEFVRTEHPALHPGRSAAVMLDGVQIGVLGELHPRWQQHYDLPLAPVLFELDVQALQARHVPKYQDVPKFQPVQRDLAFVVTQQTAAADLIKVFDAARQSIPACAILQSMNLFDEYRGKGLGEQEKSLAFSVTLQDAQATLQDEAVEAAVSALVALAAERCGARLR
ncbi:phenylalanine--tRNA ligase subunit beta [Massilia sp. W12]|uniref:phenylalanine--tRNA ligase subunit beta n=1 Tax=Massilia sp. W12 TaxID=3126507 RepID=UPI0030CCF6BE